MKRQRRRTPLPLMAAELAAASWEVILRRSLLMAGDRCSAAEYRRMVAEKARAAQRSGASLLSGRATPASLLAPWHGAATRNAKRLRRRTRA